ncbi:uncharacterized protein FA14DRAFT_160289 [Meira miltonrushii]|uniref:Uncharacterized protein n=1 Tax=Meira miltonrushii TaxID=1280837 RepID=A0A316VEX8_9BASI|nr:uncharacterized protein FA14DRAFT_160289 [Meira miltonrushii]PWN34873.1 hypothetical protein FA14DRAFT_160289 [Meira miltonrushii]
MSTPANIIDNPASPKVENWDDDEDLDFSNVDSRDALQLPSSRRQSIDLLVSQADDITGKSSEDDQIMNIVKEDLHDDEEEEEDQGDTLRVSDLTTETLAKLATYAKKKKADGTETAEASKDDDLANLNQASLQHLDDQHDEYKQIDQQDGGGDDWDEGLEIPNSFSLQSLKVRHSSSASEIDFETPSQTSASDATSLSITSDHQEDISADQSLRPLEGGKKDEGKTRELDTSASETPFHTFARNYQDNDEEDGFYLPDQMQALHLTANLGRGANRDDIERQSVISSHPSEEGWDSLSPSKHKQNQIDPSERGSAAGDLGNDVTEEDFDELDFDSFQNEQDDSGQPEGSQQKPLTLAQQLQARLNARKSSAKRGKGESGKEGTLSHGETELTSGLVITDDLDLSPSRLKARSLSSRLREAAHLRRKRQGEKQTQSSFLDHKSKHREQMENFDDQASIYSSSTKSSKDRLGVGRMIKRASSPILKGNKRSREGLPDSSSGTKSYVGQWTETLTNRFSTSRPSTPTRTLSPSGRVATQQAGSMGYAMPTAASLARLSPPQERDLRSSMLNASQAPKIMRKPRKPRKYGDGKELEDIADLPVPRSPSSKPEKAKGSKESAQSHQQQIARPNESTKGSSKHRKKKQPILIRNLGGSGSSSKMVGDMRWNPTLKKWEGNEQEGRDFENAIRGTGRPALISHLSFGPMKISSDAMSPPPPVIVSSSSTFNTALLTSPTAISSPSASLNVVGGMVFDPIKLCWKRQDGQEEEDPFEALADESGSDSDKDGLMDESVGTEEELRLRKMRQRTASAEALRIVRQSDPPIGTGDDSQLEGDYNDAGMHHSISQTIRSSVSFEKSKVADIPVHLKGKIPESVWNASIIAQRRHVQEMAGYRIREKGVSGSATPLSVSSTSTVTSPRPVSRGANPDRQRVQLLNREGPLYLIQSLSRMAARGT